MSSLAEEILELLKKTPNLTDREITNTLRGNSAAQQPVNIAARALNARGFIRRIKRADGKIGNTLSSTPPPEMTNTKTTSTPANFQSEDDLKTQLVTWLELQGWTTQVAWGRTHGVDIEAQRDSQRWLIEVKGSGTRDAMRVNYFLGLLGETLQRMTDANAQYSIAMPDIAQFRRLWARLPRLAKERTGITALFITLSGEVEQV